MKTKYQLAEIFTSIQGEGADAGRFQTFIRFAGCSVGKYKADRVFPWDATCTAWTGKEFACDTNYLKSEALIEDELLAVIDRAACPEICITGGEPADRDLRNFLQEVSPILERHARGGFTHIHVETSGTKDADWLREVDWLVVSPKAGYLPEVIEIADELRFVWSAENTSADIDRLISIIDANEDAVAYVSPLFDGTKVNEKNVQSTIELIREFPFLRMSVQTHKFLGLR